MNPYDLVLVDYGGIGGVYDSTVAVALALTDVGINVAVLAPDIAGCTRWRTRAVLKTRPYLLEELDAGPRYVAPEHLLTRRMSFVVRAVQTALGISWAAVRLPTAAVAVEGRFVSPAILCTVLLARRGRRVLYVPHNSFSRYERPMVRRIDDFFIGRAAKAADLVVLHDESRGTLPASIDPVVAPLAPPALARLTARCSSRGEGRKTLVTPGYLRQDKGVLGLASLFAARQPSDLRYRVVAPGPGDPAVFQSLNRIAWEGLELQIGYLPPRDLVAELDAADVLVLPYQRSSGSGLLEIAVAIGLPVVATPFDAATEWAARGAAVTVATGYAPEAVLRAVEVALGVTPADMSRRIVRGRQVAQERMGAAVAPYKALADL